MTLKMYFSVNILIKSTTQFNKIKKQKSITFFIEIVSFYYNAIVKPSFFLDLAPECWVPPFLLLICFIGHLTVLSIVLELI